MFVQWLAECEIQKSIYKALGGVWVAEMVHWVIGSDIVTPYGRMEVVYSMETNVIDQHSTSLTPTLSIVALTAVSYLRASLLLDKRHDRIPKAPICVSSPHGPERLQKRNPIPALAESKAPERGILDK